MPSNGVSPVVFDAPTLGHPVRLGELYDERSGKFLGVQLYSEKLAEIHQTVTDIRHTELSVSLSSTYEEKASLLDINAKLSLEILSGLVTVSGSASYLNDEKANTHEYAYALALKMRLNEKRILFAEHALGRNVLKDVQEDYIKTNVATHFVSSIVYGGNFIVNLVARESELSQEETVQGALGIRFDKLKGAISLEGEADATIKGEFKDMNDRFDLVVHGDVKLDKVPVNPEDILDTFPNAASLISKHGGVPISVTLQPISPKLYTGSLIYHLDADFVDDVLKAFSMLDDVRSRFLVLKDNIRGLEDFVPLLAQTTRLIDAVYTKDHNTLRNQLKTFLKEYQHGKPPGPGSIFASEGDDPFEMTGDKIIDTVTKLCRKHLDPNQKDSTISDLYPSSLAGLENELSRFRHFISDIKRVKDSLQRSSRAATTNVTIPLSKLDDVVRAIAFQSKVPLFIMTPMPGDNSSPDLDITRYLAIVRKYFACFEDSRNTAYMVYVENLDDLEHRLPNNKKFSSLKSPSLFLGDVDDDGNLTWAGPLPVPGTELTLLLDHNPASQSVGDLSLGIDPVDGAKAYSIQVRAVWRSASDFGTILHLERQNQRPHLTFRFIDVRLQVYLDCVGGVVLQCQGSQTIQPFAWFMATFVQDIQNSQWKLYLNDNQPAVIPISYLKPIPNPTNLRIALREKNKSGWWKGGVSEVKAFECALTKEEIKAQYLAWEKPSRVGMEEITE